MRRSAREGSPLCSLCTRLGENMTTVRAESMRLVCAIATIQATRAFELEWFRVWMLALTMDPAVEWIVLVQPPQASFTFAPWLLCCSRRCVLTWVRSADRCGRKRREPCAASTVPMAGSYELLDATSYTITHVEGPVACEICVTGPD